MFSLHNWNDESNICRSSRSLFLGVDEIPNGSGDGPSSWPSVTFDYHHHLSLKIPYEMCSTTTREWRSCQSNADVFLREVADELLKKYLHVENVSHISRNVICG